MINTNGSETLFFALVALVFFVVWICVPFFIISINKKMNENNAKLSKIIELIENNLKNNN